jgi:hypothetical protein
MVENKLFLYQRPLFLEKACLPSVFKEAVSENKKNKNSDGIRRTEMAGECYDRDKSQTELFF